MILRGFSPVLPTALYRADQVRKLDACAIQDFGIPGAVLMERAGAALWALVLECWPDARRIGVVCGQGNNAGDGYVLARLALAAGFEVRVLQVGDALSLKGDAAAMMQRFAALGGQWVADIAGLAGSELIIDALLGTGLTRPVTGSWAEVVQAMNRQIAPVLAADLPSGLHADTGQVMGVAVQAKATLSFIGLKQGLLTGQGPQQCGTLYFSDLEVPAAVYEQHPPAARRCDAELLRGTWLARDRGAHKGHFGHLLVVGGAPGYAGAARLAGEAALRCGAGLVTLAVHPESATGLNLGRPELMVRAVNCADALRPLLERATVVACGPGLGTDPWGQMLWRQVLDDSRPRVLDADALNLLALSAGGLPSLTGCVLTPHPGEAARLLATHSAAIQQDRFAAIRELVAETGATVVLKGAGTLVHTSTDPVPWVCTAGNPGMAGGGMGDVLTGIIGACLAQGMSPDRAALLGVCVHGAAADRAATDGERGLLASDLFPWLRRLVNP